jgi:hypothetical protein
VQSHNNADYPTEKSNAELMADIKNFTDTDIEPIREIFEISMQGS